MAQQPWVRAQIQTRLLHLDGISVFRGVRGLRHVEITSPTVAQEAFGATSGSFFDVIKREITQPRETVE